VIETAEKEKTITEDDMEKGKAKVQDLLKVYESKIDELANNKTKEIMDS
jgi:ribosome recycling factor